MLVGLVYALLCHEVNVLRALKYILYWDSAWELSRELRYRVTRLYTAL